MKKRGYEYEMTIPSFGSGKTAVRIDSVSLTPSSGVMTGNTLSVCGVMLCAIRMKREILLRQAMIP